MRTRGIGGAVETVQITAGRKRMGTMLSSFFKLVFYDGDRDAIRRNEKKKYDHDDPIGARTQCTVL